MTDPKTALAVRWAILAADLNRAKKRLDMQEVNRLQAELRECMTARLRVEVRGE
jgi:hypothetical protein